MSASSTFYNEDDSVTTIYEDVEGKTIMVFNSSGASNPVEKKIILKDVPGVEIIIKNDEIKIYTPKGNLVL